MSFTLANALTSIETGLRDTILDGLGKTTTVADVTALRALASATSKDGRRVYVSGVGYRYRFDRYGTGTDNGTTIVKPLDVPTTGRGRWLRTTSTSAAGYFKAVELYDGATDPTEILTRLRGVKPGAVIVYDRDDFAKPSTIAGALYKNSYDFDILCVSSNLRPEHQAAIGSAVTAEADDDPGVNKITGDLLALLAGNDLGLSPGVMWCEILGRRRDSASLADRLMVYGVKVRVYASVHNIPAENTTDLESLSVQRGLTDALDPLGDPDIIDVT